MIGLPRLSIASKLYAIFALLATATVALALIAAVNSRRHAALTAEYETVLQGAQNVERLNGLIYAVRLETRGVIMSVDPDQAKTFAARASAYRGRINETVTHWRSVVRPENAEQFAALAERIEQFQAFVRAVASHAANPGQKTVFNWRDGDADQEVRVALNHDLEAFGRLYASRAQQIFTRIDDGIDWLAWVMSVLGAAALTLAAVGTLILWRAVVRPLAAISRVTEAVAEGDAVAVPYGSRRDEIGALSRSIAVFQRAMQHNKELNRTMSAEAEARGHRQEFLSAEIAAFAAAAERNIAELSAISEQMVESSTSLADAADHAARRTEGASAASAEASGNVRDIASAADELAASVMEIDRQVAQSNSVVERAVTDAEHTNAAVQELGEAGKRIGDVVRLITEIAEQTNLLALNATIEAARAGEAGRGFAVVAGEVKALAGQTAKATDDIARQIADMQHATQRSIAAIAAIERTIRDIGAISGAIASAVTEQGAATQEIARSAEVAARRTNDTAEEVGRVSDATDNTRANVETVKTVARDLDAVAHRIRDQVEGLSQKLRSA
jgi:methyl-accepting chemotaxis protein